MSDAVETSSPEAFRNALDRLLETLLPSVHGQPWALLDWPGHTKVGDSAIWLGTLAALERRFGRPPAFLSRSTEFPHGLDDAMSEGIVFLLGGGNFGDLWGGVHENRLRVLQGFRHRRIIQLPQSIHFRSQASLEATRKAVEQHPDFTLLVRDKASFAFAETQFSCPALLGPDMAYGLGSLAPPAPADTDVFSLLRTDLERQEGSPERRELARFGPCEDWTLRRAPGLHRAVDAMVLDLSPRSPALMRLRERAYRRYARKEVLRGARLLARGRLVVTDRLHAHILCHLMGRPHIVLDNSYGKIFGFIETWPRDGNTFMAKGLTDIEAIIGSRSRPVPASGGMTR